MTDVLKAELDAARKRLAQQKKAFDDSTAAAAQLDKIGMVKTANAMRVKARRQSDVLAETQEIVHELEKATGGDLIPPEKPPGRR